MSEIIDPAVEESRIVRCPMCGQKVCLADIGPWNRCRDCDMECGGDDE